MTIIDDIAAITDPVERTKQAHRLIDERQAEIEQLSLLRRDALQELINAGMTQVEIARMLAISKARVSTLLSSRAKPRPERAFWGKAPVLVVAIGAKKEANKPADAGDVVSFEAVSAFEEIAAAVRDLGLDAIWEAVPEPGIVDLARDGLVVLTNPRLLPGLAQVMGADPALRYLHDQNGWYLRDLKTGQDYRSPRDAGETADYGYVGRLPRPDRNGTFLYCAGLHAPGTWGAARWLAAESANIYQELRTRPFSAVVRCTWRPDNHHELLTAERVSELYRHEGS